VNSFIIGKIEVPKALSEIGYSSGVVGYQVRDEIYRVIHARPGTRGTVPRGRTPRMIETATPAVEIPGDVPAITIPETGISLQSFIGYLESFMPEAWRHVVSGEIIKLGEQSSQFSMRLRLNDSLVFTGTSNGSDAVEVLVRKSAPILVETMYRDRLARNSQCLELITW
jgi:hypothetical protein